MQPHLSIVTLGVHDLAAAIEFYKHGLRLPYSAHSNDHIAFFELRGSWLALFPKTSLAEDANVPLGNTSGFAGITLAHNVASKTEVDQVMQEAERAGATITKPAQDVFWGGYSGYFTDLDGYLWEIAWNPHFEIS